MPASASSQLLAFRVMDHAFVLDVHRILELLRGQQAVSLPGTQLGVRGLLTWRNRSLPALSLRQLLFDEPVGAARFVGGRTIVLQTKGQLLALEVDAIENVVEVRPEDVLDDAGSSVTTLSPFVLGCCRLGARQYLMLDVRPLLQRVTPQGPPHLLLQSGSSA